MSMLKLAEIRTYLNNKYFERSQVIEALLCALVARQHLLLISPPGAAKSALSEEMAYIIQGANYYEHLMTKFSTPEEVFGPLSLSELAQDVYKRNITGSLPEAHIAFEDEIFKANSAVLNTLLKIINERQFKNGTEKINCPLMTMVAASNEYPGDAEGLEALFDRFLIRFEVPYLQDDMNFLSMLRGDGFYNQTPSMTLDELKQLQEMSDMVLIPDTVLYALAAIRRKLRDEGIQPSDRRYKQALTLLRAKAMLEQRMEVVLSDIMLLQSALWVTPDQRPKVESIVEEHALDRIDKLLREYEAELDELVGHFTVQTSSNDAMEINVKIADIGRRIGDLTQDQSASQDQKVKINEVADKVTAAVARMGTHFLGLGGRV
ncbi:AAA family ATPase [Paenibacillus sp. LjRoot153]|uniref:AAA family ATPase n=1 Tax=Paenibacillus sp. LjRoot153 TaxID=3342270 RepID=UPI003ECCF2AD